MKQIGIDICNLPEVDGCRHLIVCIDYFSKWSEAKATKDKSAPTVAQFIYDIICHHGCVKIHINDQGKEFVNEVSKNLHEMTGTEQRVTSAYHPQSNGLCERQSRTIKDSFVKVLEEKPKEWPSIIEGTLFARRVSVHYSTKYSPFFLMYNRHPVLLIDIKYDLIDGTANNDFESDPFDIETFQAVLNSAVSIREATHHQASRNIEKAQAKQQKDYNNWHRTPKAALPVGSKVLLENQKCKDRKGGKFTYKWMGPYTVKSVSKSGICVLVNEKGVQLKKNYHASLLKLYYSNDDLPPASEPPASPIDQDDIISHQPNSQYQTTKKSYFDQLHDEIVEMILMKATTSDTFDSISNTCRRFKSLLEERKEDILPMVHIDFPEKVYNDLPRRSNKVKVSVKKLSICFGPTSGIIECISKGIGKKNWRSAWLLMEKRNHNWFVIDRVFWKSKEKQIVHSKHHLQDSNQ